MMPQGNSWRALGFRLVLLWCSVSLFFSEDVSGRKQGTGEEATCGACVFAGVGKECRVCCLLTVHVAGVQRLLLLRLIINSY